MSIINKVSFRRTLKIYPAVKRLMNLAKKFCTSFSLSMKRVITLLAHFQLQLHRGVASLSCLSTEYYYLFIIIITSHCKLSLSELFLYVLAIFIKCSNILFYSYNDNIHFVQSNICKYCLTLV